MQVPGFTAEACMYRTPNLYRSSAAAGIARDGNAGVLLQDCGIGRGILCGTLIATGAAACTALCFGGPAPCATCWLAYLGGLFQFCHDCIPEWMKDLIDEFESGGGGGGGGGGGSRCCPVGTACRCGGRCVKVGGGSECTGECLKPHQVCP